MVDGKFIDNINPPIGYLCMPLKEEINTDPNIALENAIEMLFSDKPRSIQECGCLDSVPLIEV